VQQVEYLLIVNQLVGGAHWYGQRRGREGGVSRKGRAPPQSEWREVEGWS
jgi:hypothetical protein